MTTSEKQRVLVEALRKIASFPTCLTPVLLAIDALDKIGVTHRLSPTSNERDG